jgi:hypothetical protein
VVGRRRAASAAVEISAVQRIPVDLQPGDQFVQVFCRDQFPCKENKRSRGQWCDRREIIQHVVRKRIKSAVQHIPAQETEVNRIAIWPRTSGTAGTDAPVRSADIFDDDGLSK